MQGLRLISHAQVFECGGHNTALDTEEKHGRKAAGGGARPSREGGAGSRRRPPPASPTTPHVAQPPKERDGGRPSRHDSRDGRASRAVSPAQFQKRGDGGRRSRVDVGPNGGRRDTMLRRRRWPPGRQAKPKRRSSNPRDRRKGESHASRWLVTGAKKASIVHRRKSRSKVEKRKVSTVFYWRQGGALKWCTAQFHSRNPIYERSEHIWANFFECDFVGNR